METHGTKEKGRSGFTLLELMIALIIFTIISGLGIPAIKNWTDNYRINTATRDMYSKFQTAKLAATKNNTPCTITFNQIVGGQQYDYVVFLDRDGDLDYDSTAGSDGVDNDSDGITDEADEEERILTRTRFANYKKVSFDTSQGGGDGISDTFATNASGLPALSFLPNGLPVDAVGTLVSGSIFLVNIPQGGDVASITKRLNLSVSAAGGVETG
jgi:prepilin-type N-terminal cleavage/methylation domain-containing protein